MYAGRERGKIGFLESECDPRAVVSVQSCAVAKKAEGVCAI